MRLVGAFVALGLGLAAGAALADDASKPAAAQPAPALGSDTFVILKSDTNFGPDLEDADVAARFYCSSRGKVMTFLGSDHPPEFRNRIMQEWTVLTYRCVPASSANAR